MRVQHHDLSSGSGLPDVVGGTRLFLWWRALPLGDVDFARTPDKAWLASEIARAVAPAVAERLEPGTIGNWLPGERGRTPPPTRASALVRDATLPSLDGLDVVADIHLDASDLCVIVCTRDRPRSLRATLAALADQLSPPGEIVVVDNDPASGVVRDVLVEFPGVRLVEEPRPGLSVARNSGIRATDRSLVAFTDDDARPHPAWTAQVVRTLTRPGGAIAMTGLVLPAELESDGAAAFEDVSGFGQGYLPRRYDPAWFDGQRWKSTPVWQVGAGANMAFRRRAFDLVGGFDERLGAGASGCSEDSELWYRLLAHGESIDYEPAAVVLHHHRTDLDQVVDQMSAYLEGHVSALFVQFAEHRHPGELGRVALRLPAYLLRRRLRGRHDPVVDAELRGYRRGVAHWRQALAPLPPPDVAATGASTPDPVDGRGEGAAVGPAPMGPFLRTNPFPNPYTEGFFYREKMRAIRRVTPERAVTSVLELGGGRSGLSASLYPGADVVNVDLDPGFGDPSVGHRARPLGAGASGSAFVAGDATRLPFPDASFDVVTMFDLLEHVPDDATAATEAMRVLRPGGALLLSTPVSTWRYPYHRALAPICPDGSELAAEWGHVRVGYELSTLEQLVGRPADRVAHFVSPVTALAHDLAFSRLPSRARRALIAAAAPVVWIGYAAHRRSAPGLEIAAAWHKW